MSGVITSCPTCGADANTRIARLPEQAGYPGLGPLKCLECGWIEPVHVCGPDCPGFWLS